MLLAISQKKRGPSYSPIAARALAKSAGSRIHGTVILGQLDMPTIHRVTIVHLTFFSKKTDLAARGLFANRNSFCCGCTKLILETVSEFPIPENLTDDLRYVRH